MENFSHMTMDTLSIVLFFTAILTGIIRHKEQLVWIFAAQSLLVALIIALMSKGEFTIVLAGIVILTILVKALLAPIVLTRLIRKHRIEFAAPAYVSLPLMLGIALVLVLTVRYTFEPLLSSLASADAGALYLPVSAFFVSLLLAINRKGAFSQIIGILSAENCLVVFAAFMGIHTDLWLELGILADIFVWILIVSTFVSMVSRHFGTTDVSTMKKLTE